MTGSVRQRYGVFGRLAALLVPIVLLSAALAACTVVTTPQAPGNMDVTIQVQRFVTGKSHISVHFTTPNLDTVEFASGETVACNGQFLRYSVGSYIGDVPQQGDNGTYTITYTPAAGTGVLAGSPAAGAAGGATATSGPISIAVQVVPAPVNVSQPAPGASVTLNAPLVIQYQASTLANTNINVIAADARGHWTFTLPQGDTGVLSVPTSNFSSFQAGPGTLSVVRQTNSYPSGTPFHVVNVQFQNITQIPVNFQ